MSDTISYTIRPLTEYRQRLGPTFTLVAFQQAVQTSSRRPVHKASFRRILRQYGAVTPTGRYTTEALGRPAEYYTFARLTASQAARVAYLLAQWGY